MHEIDDFPEALLELGKALLRGREIDGFGFFDQRADPVDALAAVERTADRRDHLIEAPERDGSRIDRLPAGRLLAQL